MPPILSATLVGLLVGAGGTGGGALIACCIKTKSNRFSAALMGISGGIMLAMVFLDMLPESQAEAGWLPLLIGLALGALALFIVTRLIPHADAADYDDEMIVELKSKNNMVRAGKLLAVGIAIHNLPQGIAIGGGQAAGFALVLAVLLLLHNIPEGMAMAIPLKIGGVRRSQILWLALAAALPTAIGGAIGAAIGSISPVFIGGCVAFAGGAMLFLTLKELIPQAVGLYKKPSTIISIVAGFAVGGVVTWLIG